MVFPGIDIERDILARAGARIVLPEGGAAAVPLVPAPIVTGAGFRLAWDLGADATAEEEH